MSVRACLAALTTAAALVPFAGGAAHAGCADEFLATPFFASYSRSAKSQYFTTGYVEPTGSGAVVHSNELVADYTSLARDTTNYAELIAENVTGATATFVACVAG